MMVATRKIVPLLVACPVVLLLCGTALADSIDLAFGGADAGPGVVWQGGSSSLSVSSSDTITLGGSAEPVFVSFTSGPGTGGQGTMANPYTFGASPAGSFTLTGCLPGAGSSCSPTILFTGQFMQGETAYWSNGEIHFTGAYVTGSVNPLLAAYYGLPSDTVMGELNATMICSDGLLDPCAAGSSRLFDGGELVLSSVPGTTPAVPEPSTLFLLGSGLCGLTLLLRRRHASKKQ